MKKEHIALLLMFILGVFSVCEKQKAAWEGTITTVDGVTVVRNPKDPIYDEDVFSLEEELSIGEAVGREKYMFSEIRSIAVDENERIYVADSKEAHIKIFDKNGVYVKTIGKKGQGPGEIGRPRNIYITCQQQIMVVDSSNSRLTYYSLDGEFIKDISIAETRLMTTKIDSQGNIIGIDAVRDEKNPRYELKKFDPDLNYLYSFGSSPLPDIRSFDPFMPVLRWDLNAKDQIICGYPKTYEMEIFDNEGKLIKRIEKDYEPAEVTQEDIDKLEELPPTIKLSISKYHSAYERLISDDECRIFVLTSETVKNGDENYYDVFDSDGRYIAKVPLKFWPRAWKKGKLYAVVEDEEGFQFVKRYKVTWNY